MKDLVERQLLDPGTSTVTPVYALRFPHHLSALATLAHPDALFDDARKFEPRAPNLPAQRGGPDNVAVLLKKTRDILECKSSKCDGYCHGCLLTFDTQTFADQLDRRRAAGFLSKELLDALELPAADRLFGDGTRLELRDVTGYRCANGSRSPVARSTSTIA